MMSSETNAGPRAETEQRTERWTLWDGRFVVLTTANPHLPPEEGCHLLVAPKDPPPHAWADPGLTAATFELTARVCQVLERLGIAPWFNLQRLTPQ